MGYACKGIFLTFLIILPPYGVIEESLEVGEGFEQCSQCWVCGKTYKEDMPYVVNQIQALIDNGDYPNKLF